MSGWTRLYIVWAVVWGWGCILLAIGAATKAEMLEAAGAAIYGLIFVPLVWFVAKWVMRGFRNPETRA